VSYAVSLAQDPRGEKLDGRCMNLISLIKYPLYNGRSTPLYIGVFLCVLLVAGCSSGRHVVSRYSLPQQDVVFDTVAVVPFQKVHSGDRQVTTVRCPLSGVVMSACESSPDAGKNVEKIFTERFFACGQPVILPSQRVGGVYKRIVSDSFTTSPLETLQQAGKELGVDAVVAGYVFCFRERKGYTYSIESPATVAFSVHLVRVSDGTLMWSGIYDRTQKSLTENVLDISSFIRMGGKWVTAEELAVEGVDEILDVFPLSK